MTGFESKRKGKNEKAALNIQNPARRRQAKKKVDQLRKEKLDRQKKSQQLPKTSSHKAEYDSPATKSTSKYSNNINSSPKSVASEAYSEDFGDDFEDDTENDIQNFNNMLENLEESKNIAIEFQN